MAPDPSAIEDVQALFNRIKQSDLPYRTFERPAAPEARAPEPQTQPSPPPPPPLQSPQASSWPSTLESAAFLSAYAPRPEAGPLPTEGPIPLKLLFAVLAARGRRGPG
jgi:hypothetical protein